VTVALAGRLGNFAAAEDIWDHQPVSIANGRLQVQVTGRNAAVIRVK